MTDRIDIDDLDVGEEREEAPNRGDWFWAGESDPGEERGWLSDDAGDGADADVAHDAAGPSEPTTPRVPRTDDEAPVGIPSTRAGQARATPRARRRGRPTPRRPRTTIRRTATRRRPAVIRPPDTRRRPAVIRPPDTRRRPAAPPTKHTPIPTR
ncbi:hypothetical protein ACFQJD_13690 [Haloplanus sp. GCM10025708]|uniref:hypothetical protein n=1 Tax=Haloferacaceae TaxID=1644056 RepID=UPI00361606A4